MLISAASTSICKIFAFLANFFALPITLSENLAPITISRSHSVIPRLLVLVPCIPTIPVYFGSEPSNAPLPISVSATGASVFDTNVLSSSLAFESITPPPTSIYGFFAPLISDTAFKISSSLISALGLTCSGSLYSYSKLSPVTSFVISISTGPGLPVTAILKALLTVSASLLPSFTIKLYFVTGITIPDMSTSWNESFPSRLFPTLHVIATIGMESIYALAIPVTRLVAPGPLVARHTPTLPLALA